MNLTCQKDLFNLDMDVTYLNGAYMSPLMKSVEEAGIKGLRMKRMPSQFGLRDFFDPLEELKKAFAKLINTEDVDRITAISSVSYGMANVARNVVIDEGETICLIGDQFPSNYYVWDRLAKENNANIHIVNRPEVLEQRGKQWNADLINAIVPGVKVVSMCHVHWADGTLFDLKTIRQKCDEVGAYLIIDGTQSVGALPFDQNEFKVDALICAGYKWLCGPYSYGVAFYGEKFDSGIPIEESWINRDKSDDFKNLINYQDVYRPGAQRYAVGESSNFILLPMLLESIKQLNIWQPSRIQNYCAEIGKPLEILKELGFWIDDAAYRSHHLFGVKIAKGLDMSTVQKAFEQEKISVSYRGEFIRVSPSVYNDETEIQKFANCLSNLVKDFS